MLKSELHKQIKEIIKSAGGIPAPKNTLQEDVEYLRICVTYHMFDLEACKRELKERR